MELWDSVVGDLLVRPSALPSCGECCSSSGGGVGGGGGTGVTDVY